MRYPEAPSKEGGQKGNRPFSLSDSFSTKMQVHPSSMSHGFRERDSLLYLTRCTRIHKLSASFRDKRPSSREDEELQM